MPPETFPPRVLPLGDRALLVEFGTAIDERVNQRALGFASRVSSRGVEGVLDVVPAYASVAIHFDPLRTRVEEIESVVTEELADARAAIAPSAAVVEIPCSYGGAAGPDLDELAAWAGCSVEDVISRHCSCEYRVYMIGFLPGFPYMAEVDRSIAMPRRDTPRLQVPAGSVGIAGLQTGIYPVASPGGWRIVGRTPIELFDVSRVPPSRLVPGARVRFVPIDEARLERAEAAR